MPQQGDGGAVNERMTWSESDSTITKVKISAMNIDSEKRRSSGQSLKQKQKEYINNHMEEYGSDSHYETVMLRPVGLLSKCWRFSQIEKK